MRKAALFFLSLTFAGSVQAGSFTDVPRSHWAYQAIRSLETSGLIQGKQGKFDGNKAFSRYEMAVVLARYMEKLGDAKKDIQNTVSKTYPLLKKLADEFSKELDLLGIKHQDVIARVTSLETRTDVHQRELQELRAMVEENRRLLLQGGYAGGVERPVVPQGTPRAAASLPPVYRSIEPPPAPQAYAPPAPIRMEAASYAPAPLQVQDSLFASLPEPEPLPGASDAQRLQELRLRARGLLNGTVRREVAARPSARPAPAARMQLAATPQSYNGYSRDEILNTIDRVRSGELDPSVAQQYGQISEPAPMAAPAGGLARRQTSKVYPLSERLFGTLGLGPPSGE